MGVSGQKVNPVRESRSISAYQFIPQKPCSNGKDNFMRIAYVEDNPTNLALVERVASMNKHTIVSYSEGETAIQELTRETFDLILMDVELAGEMNGLDVVRHLRGTGLKTPIIAVTAYAMQGDLDRCIAAGCNDYLSKPLPIVALLAMMT